MVDKLSESSKKLRDKIEKAIEDQIITREEYDKIIHIATEDGYVDNHERVLLQQLQEMIADKSVKFGKNNLKSVQGSKWDKIICKIHLNS